MISRIKRVPLKEVWRHEAYDFSTWLRDNIDVVSEVIGVELINPETEQKAGDFRIDLLVEDNDGSIIVIENQLDKSDHDHLGKILVYKTAYEAKAAIWIVSEARNEHIKVINWLNESTDSDFYMLKLEAIKIDESPPAPLLTLIVAPSEEARVIGIEKKEWAYRENVRYDFWFQLLEGARDKTSLHAKISPGKGSWINASAGINGLSYQYFLRKNEVAVGLYIDRGTDSEDFNKQIFDYLLNNKSKIEEEFGEDLEWFQVEGTRHCRITKTSTKGGWMDQEEWDAIHDWMIESMIRLHKALNPFINELKRTL